ncbi:MAG: 4-hydroxy-3-methylbut-2-enyl diphosphate reductase [Candidatus Caldatribacteriota bacterium]|nr:4-hydroxy-3-methylbut-2-enyl diphosphate reductase [Candidatus Caldatribacteriota bacterium]
MSKKMGFCFGVKKSIVMANKTIIKEKGTVYMLGPIIHNPQVIEDYQQRGVKVVNNLDQIPVGSITITRAHGISSKVRKLADNKKLTIIDTTCPNVKKLQQIASFLNKNQYFLIIFGDKKHPEILSILEMVKNNALIIEKPSEIAGVSLNKKIGFISQTTKNIYSFKKLASYLLEKTKELRIFNTICPETMERQESAFELSKKVDVMLVIGGKMSANTSRLAEICKNQGVKTYHIETKAQLKQEWFCKNDKVGISSGASTPDYLTNEIVKQLKEWYY